MSPKMGRPTTEPKNERITVRLDEKTSKILSSYCEKKGVDRACAIRHGIKKLESEIK